MNATASLHRVVLITGAGGGLGQGLVREFAAAGWRVVAASRRVTAQSESESVWPAPLDVTHRGQVQTIVEHTLARWGRIDALINNAGVAADRPIWQLDDPQWNQVLEVNLKGAFLCSQAVLGAMVSQRDGHIVNISSFSGRAGARGQANYAAAKAGLIGLTQSLAREFGSLNVRVNAILPGVLPTPMTASLNETAMTEFAAANALGRINSVEEVARFVVFLAAMQNVSGQIFQLDSRTASWT